MNIDFNNPIYILGALVGTPFLLYFYTQYIKNKRIKFLKKMGFTVKTSFNRWNVSGIAKLSPDIMESEKRGVGTFKLGNDPDVWWLATLKKNDFELYIFKIYKFHANGANGVAKEWLVITVKNINDRQFEFNKLHKVIPTPDQFTLLENGVSLVYRDLLFSSAKLKGLIKNLLSFQKTNGLV